MSLKTTFSIKFLDYSNPCGFEFKFNIESVINLYHNTYSTNNKH